VLMRRTAMPAAGIAGLAGAQRACTNSASAAALEDAVPLLATGDPPTLFSGKIAMNAPRADGCAPGRHQAGWQPMRYMIVLEDRSIVCRA
jgi:hypothetical protein